MAPLTSITISIPEVKTNHKAPYSAISPLRPELSQAGKTVLIAGGSTGIGYAIARAFVEAQASRVILLGRRESVLKEAAAKLMAESQSGSTTVIPHVCDIVKPAETAQIFDYFKQEKIHVDVLVLNAATLGGVGAILDIGVENVWKAYEINVRALLDLTERLYKQEGKGLKFVVNVSTSGITNFDVDGAIMPTYGLTKNAAAVLMQQIAKDVKPDEMQIVSFHPGAIFTELAKNNGITEELYDWDDERLPGQFAVWAASPEASFAHGRVLAAHWDVDELKSGELERRFEEQRNYLKLGLVGAVSWA